MAKALSPEPAKQESIPQRTGDSSKLIAALESPKIKDCDNEELKQKLRYVMVKIGLRSANWPTEEEKLILIEHIKENFAGNHVQEIILAFDMAITGKLDAEANCYENFSCLYFSNIMYAYRLWSSQEYRQLRLQPTNVKQLVYSIDPKKELIELFGMMKKDYAEGRLKDEYIMPSVYDKMIEHKVWQQTTYDPSQEDKIKIIIGYLKA